MNKLADPEFLKVLDSISCGENTTIEPDEEDADDGGESSNDAGGAGRNMARVAVMVDTKLIEVHVFESSLGILFIQQISPIHSTTTAA